MLQPAAAGRANERAAPLTVPQFAGQLGTLAAAVERTSPESAPALAASVPASVAVTDGPQEFSVRLDWVRTALLAATADRTRWSAARADVVARLRAMQREASQTATVQRPRDARDALSRVLASRGFQNARTRTWQTRVMQAVTEWIADLWGRTLGRRVGTRTIGLVLAWAASIGAVAVLLIWLTRAAVRRRADAPIDLGSVGAARAAGRELALEAAALARAGHVREAVRVAYRAAVQRLEEEGALRVDDARTPREYLRLLPAPHRRRQPLALLTSTFERIWYGSRPPRPEDGAAIISLLQDLECLSPDRAS